MKLSLYRSIPTLQSTPGSMFLNGGRQCYTLEPPPGRCVPAGEYVIKLYASSDFQRMAEQDPWFKTYSDAMPHLIGLPEPWSNPSIVMIHPLNYPSQTKGCIGVGENQGINAIGNSRPAFSKLYSIIQAAIPDVSIQIFDPPATDPTDSAWPNS